VQYVGIKLMGHIAALKHVVHVVHFFEEQWPECNFTSAKKKITVKLKMVYIHFDQNEEKNSIFRFAKYLSCLSPPKML
jgi:hypothetical protein